MRKKWKTPQEWLQWNVDAQGFQYCLDHVLPLVDDDTILDCFREEMEEDGYFGDEASDER